MMNLKMKKQMWLNLGMLAVAAMPLASFAEEGSSSHGGNAVVCFDNAGIADQLVPEGKIVSKTIPQALLSHITSVETLDLYEAKNGDYGDDLREVLPLEAGETEDAYIERITNRFGNWTPVLKDIVEKGRAMIGKRVRYLDDETLIPVQDIEPMTKVKNGCVYTNMAQQAAIGDAAMKKLVIDNRLYGRKETTSLSRSTLKLHEYVLAYTTFYLKAKNSEGARAITARMIAKNTNAGDFSQILNAYGVKDDSLGARVVPAAVREFESKLQDQNYQYAAQVSDYRLKQKQEFVAKHWDELSHGLRKHFVSPVVLTSLLDNYTSTKSEDVNDKDFQAMKSIKAEYEVLEAEFINQTIQTCLSGSAEKYNSGLAIAEAAIRSSNTSESEKAKLSQAVRSLPNCSRAALDDLFHYDGRLSNEVKFDASKLYF